MAAPEHDVITQAWAAITVRVAWTLRREGIRITRDRLRDAREHVLWHLAPGTAVHQAEDLAERLVRAWVAQAEGRPWRPRFPEDDDHPLPQRWRDALFTGLPPIARLVLWKHYADGVPLHRLADKYEEADRLGLEAAREGLRETLREVARQAGRPVDGWADDRMDGLIHRLAQVGMQPAPSLLDVVDGQRPDAVRACVRSARAWSLVNDDHVARADLVPPSYRARPEGVMPVVALQLTPETRHRRSRLRTVFPASFPLGDEVLLVHAPDAQAIFGILADRARTAWPTRDEVRGAHLVLEGRWSAAGPLGPGPRQVPAALRQVRWGTIDGLGELPAALPAPPSAAPWWVGVAAVAALAVGTVQWAMAEGARRDHPFPLTVQAVPARQGVWLSFDVDDLAHVLVVRQGDDGLEVVLDGHSPVDKAQVATGDGGFRLHAPGEAALIASTTRPVAALRGLVDGLEGDPDALAALALAVREEDPTADVRLVP